MTPDPSLVDVLPTAQGYDRWAHVYDSDGNPLIALEEPHVDQLLRDVNGRTVLDVGCGTGRHALRLAAAGAKVTAMDFSAEMLARGRTKPQAESVQWLQHDLAVRWPFEAASFDRVVCGLVIEHVADLRGMFSEMRRVCRRDGIIVVSGMHPAMMLRGVTARFTDPATGRETRPHSFDHTISDFVMGITQAGLTIEHMREAIVPASLVSTHPRAERYVGWPMLILFGLRP